MNRTRISTAIAAAAIAGLALVGSALPAGAATGPGISTPEAAGYQFTGAQFRFVAGTVFLRNANQYHASIPAVGQSVQLWGGGRVYVLGISTTTDAPNTPYNAQVAVFSNSSHALVCAASLGNCQGNTGGFPAANPAGTSVRLAIYYNRTSGMLTFTAGSQSYSIDVGTGVSFRTARVVSEFGNDPWSPPSSFSHPSATQKLAAWSSGNLTNYNGKHFGYDGYFTRSLLTMTGPGSVPEASAGALNSTHNGFATSLLP